MKNELIKCIVVLSVICLVISVALAAVNFVTSPIIEKNALRAEHESLYVVLPDADEFEDLELPVGVSDSVTAMYKDKGGKGYAVAVSCVSQYSKSPMTFTVGVDSEGKIVAVELTNYSDTKDFGADYPNSYAGLDADGVKNADLVAGVTYSSQAFKNAMSDALEAVKEVRD